MQAFISIDPDALHMISLIIKALPPHTEKISEPRNEAKTMYSNLGKASSYHTY